MKLSIKKSPDKQDLSQREQENLHQAWRAYQRIVNYPIDVCAKWIPKSKKKMGMLAGEFRWTEQGVFHNAYAEHIGNDGDFRGHRITVFIDFVQHICQKQNDVNAKVALLMTLMHEHGHAVRGPGHDASGLMSDSMRLPFYEDGKKAAEHLVALAQDFNKRYDTTFNIPRLREILDKWVAEAQVSSWDNSDIFKPNLALATQSS